MIKHDTREYVFVRDFYSCVVCHSKENLGVAHSIKSGKGTVNFIRKFVLSKYNIELSNQQINLIIHDPLNLNVACNGPCNDSLNIFNKPVKRDELLIKILYKLGFLDA